MTKQRNASIPRAGKDGKTYWHKVGRAFDFDKGTVVFLDSLPIPDKDGKCAIHLFEIEEQQGAAQAGAGLEPTAPAARRSMKDLANDDIPF